MKKIVVGLLSFFMLISLVACNTTKKSSGIKDGTYTGSGQGNNGPISVEVVVKDTKLNEIKVTEHNETKGLGDVAMDAIIALMIENNTTNTDVVTGATYSSKGLQEAVNDALMKAGATKEDIAKYPLASFVKEELESEYTFDVVIIGAGGAGLSAAIEASKNGASVVVLEKTPAAGGNTLVSGGGINAANTRQQIGLNIEDTAEIFYNDTLKGGDNQGDPKLVKVMTEKSLEAADWLMDEIGVEFISDRVQQFGGHSKPRALIPVGNKGVELINKLLKVAEAQGVRVFYNMEATKLEKQDDTVNAVYATKDGKEIKFNASKGIVVATGGFAANLEMRKEYNPNYDERFKTTATLASTGDGIIMAQGVGADVVSMEYIQVYPTCNPITGIISYVANSRFDGALLFNQEGTRFVNEMGRRDDISNAILNQTGQVAYLVWGQEIETVGTMTQLHKVEFEQWQKDDLIYVAETLEDAANHYGIDAAKLQETIAAYNESIKDEVDEDFNKGGKLRPISEGKFYIQKVVPSTHHTMGGLKINEHAEVIDTNGNVIKGLFAAGEVTGGIHGTNRLGGNAITDIIVFGRIAGTNVSK
ncbi:MAG: flavocytochrome c [Erysipelotrichaceae bacterium]|nr:flavocytochrome c [Erysipelotrichaceae bacterium]